MLQISHLTIESKGNCVAEPPQTSQESGIVLCAASGALASCPRPFGARVVLLQTNAFAQLAWTRFQRSRPLSEVEVEVEVEVEGRDDGRGRREGACEGMARAREREGDGSGRRGPRPFASPALPSRSPSRRPRPSSSLDLDLDSPRLIRTKGVSSNPAIPSAF
jgi:hypothetical protein